jgi:enamine deaminase RidA (YjgF/YER057c/UK114 family)
MAQVEYPTVAGLHRNPAFSQVAIIPPGATLVWVGGQNAVDGEGRIVGVGDLAAQARQVKANVEAALRTAGCGWADVVRVQVFLRAGQDPRQGYAPFAPALQQRPSPPLVVGVQVAALAHPDFLLEVAVEAVRP